MTITTKLSCGDKAWICEGESPVQVTVGQVRVEFTDTPGINGGDTHRIGIAFDNFKPQKTVLEQYMCIETGIGTGSVFTLDKSIFLTKEECQSAIEKA